MSGYTKLFSSILASTIWRETNETRIVWITILAMADKDGVVEASLPGLADMARVSVESAKAAIESLMKPDEWSRTQEHEGRRIEPIDGGWLILNHAKYRAKMNADERREYLRIAKRDSRDKQKAAASTSVNKCPDKSTPSTQAEAEAEAEAEAKEEEAEASAQPIAPVGEKQDSSRARMRVFTDAWCLAWKSHFGAGYLFQAAKDGAAAAALIKLGRSDTEIIDIAKRAWAIKNPFLRQQATSLAGFRSSFNAIWAELQKEGGQNGQSDGGSEW